jgi:hypothetical protein
MASTKGSVTIGGFRLHFFECKITEGEHCVLESVETGGNKELILTTTLNGVATTKETMEFYPESGTLFVEIKLGSEDGTCLLAGKDKVVTKEGLEKEGPLCEVPTAETSTKTHVVECGVKESHLRFAGKEAHFRGRFTDTMLIGGNAELWEIIEGK